MRSHRQRWERLSSHLDRALDMSPSLRQGWLSLVGADDPRLGAELASLLDEHRALVDEGFLEDSPAAPWGAAPGTPAGTGQPRYALGAEHARGGVGRIVRAIDTHLGRTVAIKELLHDDRRSEARFAREARLTARLDHPSIVPVHDAGRWQGSGRPFYAMRLVDGRALDELAADASSMRDRLALVPNVLAAAEAVAYAHSRRIIHRDLKPQNVLVGAYGETLVVDWGLARELPSGAPGAAEETDAERTPGAAERTGAAEPMGVSADPADMGVSADPADMTVVGTVLGTPAFMAPEQAQGLPVDERADVYALGATLYQVIAGEPPHAGEVADEVLKRLLAAPPPRLAERAPGAPPDLCAIVDKAMARHRRDRYRTARELAADLRRFTTGQMVDARTYSFRELAGRWARRHRAVAALTVAFLFAALAATGLLVERERSLRRRAEATRALPCAERPAPVPAADLGDALAVMRSRSMTRN